MAKSVYERGTEWGLTPDSRILDLEQEVARLKRQLQDAEKALRLLSKFSEALDRLLAWYRVGHIGQRAVAAGESVERLRPRVRGVREKFKLK